MKTLILYAYHENLSAKSNLLYFIENGIINNDNYLFCVNINGNHSINCKELENKYNNLKFYFAKGKNSFEAYKNILSCNSIDSYEAFIFIKDKVRGPYNLDKIVNKNWVDFFTCKLSNKNCVIISAYGSSPLGKIYKMPYIPMKFMVLNNKALDLLLNKNLFEKHDYDPSFLEEKRKNPENMLEIAYSHELLKNDMNYIALDINGVDDLEIDKMYPDFIKLQEITCNYFNKTDTTIHNRLFWSDSTMKALFEKNIPISKLCKFRNSKNIEKW